MKHLETGKLARINDDFLTGTVVEVKRIDNNGYAYVTFKSGACGYYVRTSLLELL